MDPGPGLGKLWLVLAAHLAAARVELDLARVPPRLALARRNIVAPRRLAAALTRRLAFRPRVVPYDGPARAEAADDRGVRRAVVLGAEEVEVAADRRKRRTAGGARGSLADGRPRRRPRRQRLPRRLVAVLDEGVPRPGVLAGVLELQGAEVDGVRAPLVAGLRASRLRREARAPPRERVLLVDDRQGGPRVEAVLPAGVALLRAAVALDRARVGLVEEVLLEDRRETVVELQVRRGLPVRAREGAHDVGGVLLVALLEQIGDLARDLVKLRVSELQRHHDVVARADVLDGPRVVQRFGAALRLGDVLRAPQHGDDGRALHVAEDVARRHRFVDVRDAQPRVGDRRGVEALDPRVHDRSIAELDRSKLTEFQAQLF